MTAPDLEGMCTLLYLNYHVY